MIVVTFFTKDYLDRANRLVQTIKYSNPDIELYLFCIGFLPTIVNFPKNFHIMKFPVDSSFYDNLVNTPKLKRGKILFFKPLIIQMMIAHNKPFLWLDCDVLVTKKLDPIFEKLDSGLCDLMITYRPKYEDSTKFPCAAIGFSNTEKSFEIIRAWNDEMKKTKHLDWLNEQIALWNSWNKIKQPKRLIPFTEYEHSLMGNQNSILISDRPSFDHSEQIKYIENHNVDTSIKMLV